jgi:hypothetical protein
VATVSREVERKHAAATAAAGYCAVVGLRPAVRGDTVRRVSRGENAGRARVPPAGAGCGDAMRLLLAVAGPKRQPAAGQAARAAAARTPVTSAALSGQAASAASVTLGQAVVAYLAEAGRLQSTAACQGCSSSLRIFLALFGADADVLALSGPAAAEWRAGAWSTSVLARGDCHREALAGLAWFCAKQGWIPAAADMTGSR